MPAYLPMQKEKKKRAPRDRKREKIHLWNIRHAWLTNSPGQSGGERERERKKKLDEFAKSPFLSDFFAAPFLCAGESSFNAVNLIWLCTLLRFHLFHLLLLTMLCPCFVSFSVRNNSWKNVLSRDCGLHQSIFCHYSMASYSWQTTDPVPFAWGASQAPFPTESAKR